MTGLACGVVGAEAVVDIEDVDAGDATVAAGPSVWAGVLVGVVVDGAVDLDRLLSADEWMD